MSRTSRLSGDEVDASGSVRGRTDRNGLAERRPIIEETWNDFVVAVAELPISGRHEGLWYMY